PPAAPTPPAASTNTGGFGQPDNPLPVPPTTTSRMRRTSWTPAQPAPAPRPGPNPPPAPNVGAPNPGAPKHGAPDAGESTTVIPPIAPGPSTGPSAERPAPSGRKPLITGTAAPKPPGGAPSTPPAPMPPAPPKKPAPKAASKKPAPAKPHPIPAPENAKLNRTAVHALLYSFFGITAPVGVYLGRKARLQIARTGETGEPYAIAALIIGWAYLTALALGLMTYLIFVLGAR
ncbi:DUF4190 domain-containing protein, partial [Gordonia sp. (in: high G+C Gram-positive bacteria)]|uniref:DUF4190 domain-containing protein n=1 Tax=Gordonia sp. (in: high G+C Gram-positive bacteria) TaxID=84139 RepID=UPI0039E687DF